MHDDRKRLFLRFAKIQTTFKLANLFECFKLELELELKSKRQTDLGAVITDRYGVMSTPLRCSKQIYYRIKRLMDALDANTCIKKKNFEDQNFSFTA